MAGAPLRCGDRLPRNSVCPGCSNPASINTDFWTGLVTMAAARPSCASCAAVWMAAITAAAFLTSSVPADGGTAHATGRTPRVPGGRDAISSGVVTSAMVRSRLSRAASWRNRDGHSIRHSGMVPSARPVSAGVSRNALKAFRAISAPIPAGSPGVTRTGSAGLSALSCNITAGPDIR